MAHKYMEIMLTPAVQRAQDKYFGRHQDVGIAPDIDSLEKREIDFIADRDSFYMGTVSETGWPYIQHRGGPMGFVKVLGPNLLGFTDLKGNRQLISTGNLDITDKAAIFMMDYPSKTRLKLVGHAHVVDARECVELSEQLTPKSAEEKVERIFLIQIVSFDWNCPQYITQRFTIDQIQSQIVTPLKDKIAELEQMLREQGK